MNIISYYLIDFKEKFYEKYEAKKMGYFMIFCAFLIFATKFRPWAGVDYDSVGSQIMAFIFLVVAFLFFWPIRDLFERKE